MSAHFSRGVSLPSAELKRDNKKVYMYTKTFYALLHPQMAAYSAAQLNPAANNQLNAINKPQT